MSRDAQIDAAIQDLARRFGERVPQQEIETAVRESFQGWDDARIHDFIPVLAQRRAAEQLRRFSRTST